jgi:hypothetical protein
VAAKKFIIGALLLSLLLIPAGRPLTAEDLSSPNFILRDPVIVPEADQTASADFQYYSTTGQTTAGESSSPSFIYRAGFEYYPAASTPAVTATAGDAQVSLSWTASVGALANVTAYEVGTSTTLGGTYSYTNVGNSFSYVKNGLTNAVPYYFIVKADAGTLTLAQSAAVSATPVGSVTPPPSTGGGGGGGGGGGAVTPPPAVATVIFSGRAYPESTVTLLVDAQVTRTVAADINGNFTMTITGLAAGNYGFSLYSDDAAGNRSAPAAFPTSLTSGATTTIGSIFIAPTLALDKSEVKPGEKVVVSGQSAPNGQVTIVIDPGQQVVAQVTADAAGAYRYNFDTAPLKNGQYSFASKSTLGNETSPFGRSAAFIVGAASKPPAKCGRGDLNCDGRVNLVDFSIAAYWYKRTLSTAFKVIEKDRLNGDGKIDLTDFSIIAYYWSG